MILKFKGEFSKDELVVELVKTLEKEGLSDFSFKGSFYLSLIDETGEILDVVDFKGKSKEIIIKSNNMNNINEKTVDKIIDLTKEGKSTKEISEILNITKKTTNSIASSVSSNLPIMKKKDLNEYMFIGLDKLPNELLYEVEAVGFYKKGTSLVDVFSLEKYCIENSIPLVSSIPANYVSLESSLNSYTTDIYPYQVDAIYLNDSYYERLVDIKKLAENNGLRFYKSLNDLPTNFNTTARGIDMFRLVGESTLHCGFVVSNDGILRRVYDLDSLYKKELGLVYLNEDEIEKHYMKSLFKKGAYSLFFPKDYGVTNYLKPYGIDLYGYIYVKPTTDLIDIFGRIETSELADGDVALPLNTIQKFRTLLKKIGIPIGDVLPDGMTENYEYVFRKWRFNEEIAEIMKTYIHLKKNEQSLFEQNETEIDF